MRKPRPAQYNPAQALHLIASDRSRSPLSCPSCSGPIERTPDEIDPTVQAQNLGYISVGLHLDPDDWKLTNSDGTPGSRQMIPGGGGSATSACDT